MKKILSLLFISVALFSLPSCKKEQALKPSQQLPANQTKENTATCPAPPAFYGVKAILAQGLNSGNTIEFDSRSNVTVKGRYQQKTDFDPGPGTAFLNGPSYPVEGLFALKLNPYGKFISVQHLGTLSFELQHPRDNKGNVYKKSLETISGDTVRIIVSKYASGGQLLGKTSVGTGVLDATGRNVDCTIKPDNKGNIFISTTNNRLIKSTDAGKPIWEKKLADIGKSKIELDKDGNIYLLSQQALIIQKISPTGALLWKIDEQAGAHNDNPVFTSDSKGNIYIASRFEGTFDLDPGPGELIIQRPPFHTYMHVRKFNPSGALIWAVATKFGNDNGILKMVTPDDIKLDPSEKYIGISGGFIGEVDFNTGTGTDLIKAPNFNTFVMSLKQCD